MPLRGHTQVSCTLGPGGKTDFLGAWARPTSWSRRVFWEVGGGVVHCRDKDASDTYWGALTGLSRPGDHQ